MNYTLEDFEREFKVLLRKAEDAGLVVYEFYQIAEYVLEQSWEEHN